MPGKVHLLFAVDQTWRSAQPEHLPPCAPPPASLEALREPFRSAAEEGVAGLVVFGWRRAVLSVIAEDQRLRQKRIIVILQREFLGDLEDAAAGSDLDLVSAVLLGGDATLSTILQHLPIVWSFAIVDPNITSLADLHHLIGNRFIRRSNSIERTLGDLENLRTRLGRIPKSIPLTTWRDAYHGRAALCIAAGPSLDRRMDFIRAHAPYTVIIVVDVVASRLQNSGIPVDFVVNVDSGEDGAEFFRPSVDAATTLIMPLNGHINHDQRFNQVSYFDLGSLHQQFIGPEASFAHGTIVGVATVGFAQYLGCREIILLGHDLAYEDGAYYSSLAGPDDGFATREESIQRKHRVDTPGNNGHAVPTNQLFRIAVDDFGLLLRFGPVSKVYNPNINDQIGALIPQTLALPAGWAPDITSNKIRPHSENRVTVPKEAPTADELITWLFRDAEQLLACWHDLVGQGHCIASAYVDFENKSRPFPCESLVNFAFEAFVVHQLRLFRTPYISANHPTIVTSTQSGIAAIHAAVQVLRELKAPPLDLPPDPELDAFLATSWRVDHGANDTTDNLYRSIEAVLLSRLWSFAPLADGTEPLSAEDGLALVTQLGTKSPRSLVLKTLTWCALDERAFAEPLAHARRCGLLIGPQLTAAADTRGGNDGAVESLLRLEIGAPRDGDVQRACHWHACHARLLIHLLKTRPALAIDLLRSGSMHLDDHTSSLLVHHHPELTKATEFLAQNPNRFSQATTLALAGRLVETSAFSQAIPLLQSIRQLSRFRNQSLALQAESLLNLDRADEALSCALSISDPALAMPYALKAGCLTGSWQVVANTLRDDCPPNVLALVLSHAWRAKKKSILELVRDIASAPSVPAAEHPTIANAATKMLAALETQR